MEKTCLWAQLPPIFIISYFKGTSNATTCTDRDRQTERCIETDYKTCLTGPQYNKLTSLYLSSPYASKALHRGTPI